MCLYRGLNEHLKIKGGLRKMEKHITFYFSWSEIIEGKDEAQIISKAEIKATEDLKGDIWDYFDSRTIEED